MWFIKDASEVFAHKSENEHFNSQSQEENKGKTGAKSAFQKRTRYPLHISQRRFLLMGIDLSLLSSTLLLGLHFNQEIFSSYTTISHHLIWFVTIIFLWITIAAINDNYEVKQAAQVSASMVGIIKTLLITGAIYILLSFVFPPLLDKRSDVLMVGSIAVCLLATWRLIYATVFVRANFKRRAIIAGGENTTRLIAQTVKDHDPCYEIIGCINGDASGHHQDSKSIPFLDKETDLIKFVRDYGVSDIVLASTDKMHPHQLKKLLKCSEEGVRIVSMPKFFEEITGRLPVEEIGNDWLLCLPLDRNSRALYLTVKRVMDIVIAGIGLLCLAPIFPLIALAIKLDSPGPIFYRPERLGQGGRPFLLWKFRTMVSNADSIGDPTFTKYKDQRITRTGRILRATHLDELPQFFNIMAGDMSLVGPRPERHVREMEESIPYYRMRYAVKPGGAGLALIRQGYAEGLGGTLTKLEYDLYYIKHQSLSLDIFILCKSIKLMLTCGGR